MGPESVPVGVPLDDAAAVSNAHLWLASNPGSAPPDTVTLAEWMAAGVCHCPDGCLVAPDAWCRHWLASWWLILTWVRHSGPPPQWDPALMVPHPGRLDLAAPDAPAAVEAHERAVERGETGYSDPASGLFVMTAQYLWDRGCCGRGCRHCPFYNGEPPDADPSAG